MFFVLVAFSCLVLQAQQQQVYYEKVDTIKVQLVVSDSQTAVIPTFGSYFTKEDWDLILGERYVYEHLETITGILSKYDFSVVDISWVDKSLLVIYLEKHPITSTAYYIRDDE